MAVFGESYSKMQSRSIDVGTVTSLQYSIIKPSWGQANILAKQSVVTAVRNYEQLSEDFANFDVICNLWKNADEQATFEEIFLFNHDTVYFMPHEDNGLYLDDPDTGNPAEFFITRMVPFYVMNPALILRLKLLITFESKVAIDPASIIP